MAVHVVAPAHLTQPMPSDTSRTRRALQFTLLRLAIDVCNPFNSIHCLQLQSVSASVRRARGHPVRRRRHPADGAGEQHQLVRRLLRPHGGFPGHEPLHGARRPGDGTLRRRSRSRRRGSAARAHPRLPHAGSRALHRAAAARAAGGGHGLLPGTRRRQGTSRPGAGAGFLFSILAPQAKAPAARLAKTANEFAAGAATGATGGGAAATSSNGTIAAGLRLHLRVSNASGLDLDLDHHRSNQPLHACMHA